jgi:hypothetical protein
MPRPKKVDNYVVHRIAELIHIADAIHDNEEVRSAIAQGGIEVEMADGKFLIIDGPIEVAVEGIAKAVGRFVCGDVGGQHLKPEVRTYVLRRLINALERKFAKERKTPPDEIALVRVAWLIAKAKLKGDDYPTFKEADDEYYRLTGWHLDRRALKDADRPVRPDKRGVKRKIATAQRNRGKE